MASARFKWREEMVYEDEGRFLVFEAPMGKSPHDVYVPPAATWAKRVPEWARDKRELVLGAIRAVSGVGKIIDDENALVGTQPG